MKSYLGPLPLSCFYFIFLSVFSVTHALAGGPGLTEIKLTNNLKAPITNLNNQKNYNWPKGHRDKALRIATRLTNSNKSEPGPIAYPGQTVCMNTTGMDLYGMSVQFKTVHGTWYPLCGYYGSSTQNAGLHLVVKEEKCHKSN